MFLSIRSRIVVLAALSALAAGGIAGMAGRHVVGRAVEDRLVHDVVENAAGLIGQLSLRLSDGMLQQMSRLLGGDLVAVTEDGQVLASSLRSEELNRLLSQWGESRLQPAPVVGGKVRIVGRSTLETPIAAGAESVVLLLLVPRETVRQAKFDLTHRVAGSTLLAIMAATVVALLLSRSITASLHHLAADMLSISQDGLGEGLEKEQGERKTSRPRPATVPKEVVLLRARFDHLLQSLRDAQRRLEHAAQLAALGKVAVSVAHELRNPLSGIRMNARILADECSDAGLPDDSICLIQREIDRMDLYLEELMSLRPGGQGEAEPAPLSETEPVQLEEAASSVMELLRARCRHAGIKTQLDIAADLPPVQGDSRRLRQVLMNLALNAMDAMPAGGRLTIRCFSPDTRRVCCQVCDSGPGVDAEVATSIFEAFVSSKPHGAGLGLYISRRIIDQHGGTLQLQNAATGAVFHMEIPAAGG